MKHLRKNTLFESNNVWSDEEMERMDILGNEQKFRYMLNTHPLSETCDFYVYLAEPTFIEYESEYEDGETLYKKSIEIENMMMIDKSDPDMISLYGMRMRSRFQPNTRMYYIWIKKGIFGKNVYGSDPELTPELKETIMKKSNKF